MTVLRFRGRASRAEREELIERLTELRHEATAEAMRSDAPLDRIRAEMACRTYDDYLLYATVGRDRKKLGMEWAEQAQQRVAETASMLFPVGS